VKSIDVAELARLLREHYSWAALDPGVTEATVVENEHGDRALLVPRAVMDEPYRSFCLIDASALDTTLVITFRWQDDAPDDTIFLLPYDTRGLDLDIRDNIAVTTFLNHLLEFTLGGPRPSWEAARSTPFGQRFAVVRPQTQEER
jgi:hypothetical protein